MPVNRRTIWRDEDVAVAQPDVTAVAPPEFVPRAPELLQRPIEPTLGIPLPGEGVEPATLKTPSGAFRTPNTASEYWDMPEDEREKFDVAYGVGGFQLAQQQYPNVTIEPYRLRGNIIGASVAFLRGIGVPEQLPGLGKVLPEVEDVSPWAAVPAQLAGEITKYAGLGKVFAPLGAAALPATGLAAGGLRQIGAEEPSLEDPLLEAIAVTAGTEIAKAVGSALAKPGQRINLVEPAVSKKPKVSEAGLARKELLDQKKIADGFGAKFFTEQQIKDMSISDLELYTGRKIAPAPTAAKISRKAKPSVPLEELRTRNPEYLKQISNKDGTVTVYRNVGHDYTRELRSGDFVTTKESYARGFKAGGKVIEARIPIEELRLIKGMDAHARGEMYYNPKAKPATLKPAKVAETPEAVAKELGIKYDGIFNFTKKGPDGKAIKDAAGEFVTEPWYQFTVTEAGKETTFYAKNLKDVANKLSLKRAEYAKAAAPLTDVTGGEASVTLGTFGYTPEVMKSIQKTWTGVVDETAKKAVTYMPQKIRDIANVFSRGHLPPEVKQIVKDREKGIILGRQHANELAESLTKNIPEKYHFEVFKTLDPTHVGDLGEIPKALRPWVQQARNKIDELGLEAVGVDLLKPEVFYRNVGEYLGRYYTGKQEFRRMFKETFRNFFKTGIKGKRFLPRKLKTTAERQKAGLIEDPAYAVANTVRDLTYDIETAKAFRRLAQNPEWVTSKPPAIGQKEWRHLSAPTDALKKKYGDLANKWIRRDIFDEVEVITETRGDFARIYDRLLGMWKFGKTALNPATHGRNIFSNVILADFAGLSPLRVDVYAKAAQQYLKKGTFYKEALEDGLLSTDWFGSEVKSLLGSVKPGKQSMFDLAFDIAGKTKLAKLTKKFGDIYQGEEHFFKLAVYMNQRAGGATRQQAAAHAQKHLFDYNDLSPFLRKLRRAPYGGPFLSFTAKALPIVAETAVKHPFRVGKYALMFKAMNEYGKTAIGMSDSEYAKMKASLPPWRRSGWQIMMPFRDKAGKPVLWDLTYNLPWGDIAEQGTFIPVPVLGAVVERFVGGNPFARVPIEIALNKDAFRDKQLFMRELDAGIPGKFAGIPIPATVGGQATEAITRHAARQFAPGIALAVPPVIETLAGKPRPSGEVPDPVVEILNRLMGIKFVSIDVERGKRIKLSKLVKLRAELISRMYRIARDESLSDEDRFSEFKKIRDAADGLTERAKALNVPIEKVKPDSTSTPTYDRSKIWR